LDKSGLVLRLTLVVLALALAQPAGAQTAADGAPPAISGVKITHCAITPPRPFSHRPTGTRIDFTNAGPTLLHHVTFEVSYATAGMTYGRSVEDDGTFAPQTAVSHHFPLYSDVTYAGTKPLSCRVTAAG
jgi:hypothetical protein